MNWTSARGATLPALGLMAAMNGACGGTVELGVDRGDGGVMVASDTGVRPGADAGPQPQGDAGNCTPRARPAIPATWPYPATKQAYLTHFFNAIPGTAAGCGLAVSCHGTGGRPPYIPMNPNELDMGTNLADATSQLWTRTRPPAGGGTPLIRSKHDPNAAVPIAPPFTPAQMAAIDMYIARSHDCAWKTAPAPMPGQCPAPNVDYCDQ